MPEVAVVESAAPTVPDDKKPKMTLKTFHADASDIDILKAVSELLSKAQGGTLYSEAQVIRELVRRYAVGFAEKEAPAILERYVEELNGGDVAKVKARKAREDVKRAGQELQKIVAAWKKVPPPS